jgi:hypothetical protein
MQVEEGMGLIMMAPARGSRRYVLVRGGVLRGVSVGPGKSGVGSRLAGAMEMRLIDGDGGVSEFQVILV